MFRTRPTLRSLAVSLVALLAATPAQAQGVNWRHDLAKARRDASAKRLPLLLDFGNDQCIWCKKLDQTTFRDPAVARLVNERFIAVKVDTFREVQFTQALHVESLPALLVAAPDGKILARKEGYLAVSAMLQFLHSGLEKLPAKKEVKAPVAARLTLCPIPELPDVQRATRARELLIRARLDREDKCYLGCLERCRLLLLEYSDLPEADQARRLAESLSQELGELRTRLADVCLEQAAALQRKSDPDRASACLEQALLLCPDGSQAREARQRLASIRRRALPKAQAAVKARR